MPIARRRLLTVLLAGTAGLAVAGGRRLASAQPSRTLRLAASPIGDLGDWAAFAERTGWMVDALTISDAAPAIRSLLISEAGADPGFDLLLAVGGLNRTLITNDLVEEIDVERLKGWAGNDYIHDFFGPDTPGFRYISEYDRIYSVPTVLQGDSFAYLPEVTGRLESYGALFDPQWAGRVALEDNVWTAGLKTALYLKASGQAEIADPGAMTPEEIRAVASFLIQRKRLGQFHGLWTSFEEAARLLAAKEVVAIDCGEPVVAAANAEGVNAAYAAPLEGYLLWALTASIVKDAARDEATAQATYDLIDFLLDGHYGATIGLARGFMTNPRTLAFVEENKETFGPEQQVKIQALDSAGRLKFQKGGVWGHRWPEHRKAYVEEWQRFKAA